MPNTLAIELILGAVAFFASVYLGAAVYLRNPKSWTNRLFGILALLNNAYIIINFLSLHPPQETPENQLFWIRMVMFITSFIGPVLILLVHTFPRERVAMRPRYLILLGLLMLTSASFALSDLIFKSIEYPNGEPIPVAGAGIPVFFADFVGLFILSFILLIYKYQKAVGEEKIRHLHLFLGILASFSLMGLTTVTFVVLLKTSAFVFLGPIFPVILAAFIAYAIVKHRFLDIAPSIARAVSYLFFIFVVAVLYSALLFGLTRLFATAHIDLWNLLIGIMLTTGIALTFQPLEKQIRKITDRVFFKGLYNFDELLARLTQAMIAKIDLDELTKSLLEILTREMRITKAAFLIIENHTIRDVRGVGYQERDFMENVLEALLHDIPQDASGSIIFDELRSETLKESFRKNDVMVAIPIRSGDKEVALLVLGPKAAGDLYSKKDLMLLEIFASESGIVIEKAQLYENLKLALESKSQFISVVSHQMRTPISAIRWSLELLQQKNLAPVKRKEFLNNAFHNSVFLVEQLDDVLTVLAIQDQEISLAKEACDVRAIADELLQTLTHEIEEKKLSLTFNFAVSDMHAACDVPKLRKVLSVLLKNAVIYTPAGGHIEVGSREEKMNGGDYLIFSVKDSGIGLTPEEQKKIFDRFYRSDRARLILPDGMGLGMFIAKTFIRAHGGSLWVESAGVAKGAVFSFSLPIKHPERDFSENSPSILRIRPVNLSYLERFGKQAEVIINLASVIAQTRVSVGAVDEKSDFLANLSHELKSPLSTIKFIAESMLRDPKKLSSAERRKIQSIHEAAERALNLSMDMINVSKFVAGEIEPKFEMCDLKSIVGGVINGLRPASELKGQKISFEIPREIHLIKICNEYLVRAFQNIFDNAVSYGRENSRITVILEENSTHDSYLVSVNNLGPVIPNSELSKMFDKFHRVPGSEKIKPTGTGLGLFIAKSAIELNGGRIWIESSEDRGTTVYFTVPFKAPRA